LTFDYLREPARIYQQSFAIIRAEADLSWLPEEDQPLAVRMIHACGMVDIEADMAITPGARAAGQRALRQGRPVIVDATMLARGLIDRASLNLVSCIESEDAAMLAAQMQTTRSAAAVELWRPYLDGAVVAIGNAPTALFRLLEILLEPEPPQPALLIATPVGFVGAAEAKAELLDAQLSVPLVTVLGRRGGTAMAAAAVNALTQDG
jgi:precorrin-8X/cobalt-precorrin-8 methylmutase